jgi:hypothetical protein
LQLSTTTTKQKQQLLSLTTTQTKKRLAAYKAPLETTTVLAPSKTNANEQNSQSKPGAQVKTCFRAPMESTTYNKTSRQDSTETISFLGEELQPHQQHKNTLTH